MSDQLDFWSEEHLANLSPLPDLGKVLKTLGGISCSHMELLRVISNLPGSCGKMSPESCHLTGGDFGTFLGMLAELGYGFAYRVLDAQYIRTHKYPRAVPQRRRRVFVVGYFGDWRPAAQVLFESESLSGNPPPSRRQGKRIAGVIKESLGDSSLTELSLIKQESQYFGHHPSDSRVTGPHDVGDTVSAKYGTGGGNTPLVMQTKIQNQPFDMTAFGTYGDGDTASTCKARDYKDATDLVVTPVAFAQNIRDEVRLFGGDGQTVGALAAEPGIKQRSNIMNHDLKVRRLTPTECERLQGFPDAWTQIPWNGRPAEKCPDAPRYKACGNSMATNVMSWIGQRIHNYEATKE